MASISKKSSKLPVEPPPALILDALIAASTKFSSFTVKSKYPGTSDFCLHDFTKPQSFKPCSETESDCFPSITIGYNQNAEKDVNIEKCKQENIQIVRRITGGKAVFIALKEDIESELVKDLYMLVDKAVDVG